MAAEILNITDQTDIDKAIMDDKLKKVDLTTDTDFNISKQEIAKYDQPLGGLELSPEKKAEELKKLVAPALDAYNKKFGTTVKYETLLDTINSVLVSDASESEVRRIINSDLIYNSTNFLVFKLILAITKTTNDMIDDFVSSSGNKQFTGENIAVLDQIFGWLDKLEKIKARYKITDLDKVLKSSMNSNKSVVRTERENMIINVLKESLK